MDISTSSTPIPARRALRKFGQDLQDARKRRRIPMRIASERAGISRSTLSKIEKGDEGVSLGAYARVLFILGMIDQLTQLCDSTSDRLGLMLQDERLPKRIRLRKQKK